MTDEVRVFVRRIIPRTEVGGFSFPESYITEGSSDVYITEDGLNVYVTEEP